MFKDRQKEEMPPFSTSIQKHCENWYIPLWKYHCVRIIKLLINSYFKESFYGFGEISIFGPLNLLFNCLRYSSTMKSSTKRHEIDVEICGSLSLMNFHTLCQQVALENCFFPNCQHFKLSLDPTSHTGFFPSYTCSPETLCRLNYALSYTCTSSLLSDYVCSDTCAIPLVLLCYRSLLPGAASEANGISLLHCRMKVARQHFCSW